MYWLPLVMTLALAAASAAPGQKLGEPRKVTAPETFNINANVTGTAGASAAIVTIKVDKYSTEADRKAVEDALKQGNAAFMAALQKAPIVGTLTMAGQTTNIRWARETPVTNGRDIVLVTDKPVYFVGAGAVAPKSREGFDVALVKFRMDNSGVGADGTMAAAAKVKAGPSGVEVEDYGEKLIELRSVSRAIK